MAELKLTLVAEGLKFPAGTRSMSDGSVVLTELEGKRVLRVTPDGEIKVVAETDGGPNGLAVGPNNALYLTNNGGSYQFFVRDGINWVGPTPAHHRASIQSSARELSHRRRLCSEHQIGVCIEASSAI